MNDYRKPLADIPDPLVIQPLEGPFSLSIQVPGSKSISTRACILAALSEGESRLEGMLEADDCDRILVALEQLGAGVQREDGAVVVHGTGGRFPQGGRLFMGDGGAPTRFMIAAACLADEPVEIDGSQRMREREVSEGVQLLQALGARITWIEEEGRLPLRVEPTLLTGGTIDVPVTSSSQFISAIMLIAPCLPGGIRLRMSSPPTSPSYIEMTRETLAAWGVENDSDGRDVLIPRKTLQGRVLPIPPDASSALYWMAAATMIPDAEIHLPGFLLPPRQPDAALLDVLQIMGAGRIPTDSPHDLSLRGTGTCRGFSLDARSCPDGALAMAALAATAEGPSRISGLQTLRTKECDRLAALEHDLAAVGCGVRVEKEELFIDPPGVGDPVPVTLGPWNDHRMVMSFAILGLCRPGISIADPTSVSKSYPGFFEDLSRLYGSR